jgi:hypothetical protein
MRRRGDITHDLRQYAGLFRKTLMAMREGSSMAKGTLNPRMGCDSLKSGPNCIAKNLGSVNYLKRRDIELGLVIRIPSVKMRRRMVANRTCR